jgi:Kef-type K+ transport system membrane component KefB
LNHLSVPHFLGLLVVILASAKFLGAIVQRIGQPAVVGELMAGVILGSSVLGVVDSNDEVLHLLAELGVVILLFEIGLETDLRQLMRVGGVSTVVAVVGVALPFGLGYLVCRLLGLENIVAVVAGSTLTATSVGITARVLSDMNRLQEPESRIILGAAVIDDVIGLVILSVVAGLTQGNEVTVLGVAKTAAVAFGFLGGTLLLGRIMVPPLARLVSRIKSPGTPIVVAIVMAFGLAWLAAMIGSAMIIGAFAAGLLLRETLQAHEMERGVAQLGHFFVPIFFVAVGAAVDLGTLNPAVPANRPILLVGGLLIVAAVVGKFAAAYAPFWFRGNKAVIGVGMIPRGEVGLIFAQMGLESGVFNRGLFSAVTLMVMVTTFMAPPLLKIMFPPKPIGPAPAEPEGLEDLVTKA